jgi:ParB-like chromosome segregation protein Spo0J
MSEQMTQTCELLTGCVQTLSEVSVRLQSIIDRFESRQEERDRLKAALARIQTPPVREASPPDRIEEYVVAGHRRRAA